MKQDVISTKSIFRENAIKNLNSLEEYHDALQVIQPSSWLLMLALFLAFLSISIWGLFGTITLNVKATGILINNSQVEQTEKIFKESYYDYEQNLLMLKKLFDQKNELYKKHYLTMADMKIARDDYLQAKEELVKASKGDFVAYSKPVFTYNTKNINSENIVLVFINHEDGKKILPSMEAVVTPINSSNFTNQLKGHVLQISEYPITKQIAYSYLQNMNLVDHFFTSGVPFIAKVRLNNHNNLPNFEAGMPVLIKIIRKKLSPLQLVMQRQS